MTPQTMTRPKQDQTVEDDIQQLRQLYTDTPQYVRTALENAIPAMTSLASEAQTQTDSAGRIGIRQGRVSELLIIVPFAPGGGSDFTSRLTNLYGFETRMASATPGRSAISAGSMGPGFPVTPIAVFCAPGITCGRKPSDSMR